MSSPVLNGVDARLSGVALAGQILQRYSRSPLDYFKLYPAKSFFFTPGSRSFVAYETALGVALCAGDPVGPPDELESAVKDFLAFYARHGRTVAFLAPQEDAIYRRLHFQSTKIGDEAIVDLEHFAAYTAQSQGFRRTRRRFIQRGMLFAEHSPPHPAGLMDELEQVSREWLTLPGRRDHGFAGGRFERSYLDKMPVYTVSSAEGRVLAFLNLIPGYLPDTCSGDLMRHRVDAPNSTMDYLFLRVLLLLRERGCRRFSLNIVNFAGVGTGPHPAIEERLLHLIYEHFNRFFSFKGLRQFKDKFEPEWIPRYLYYRGGFAGFIRAMAALVRLSGV